MKEINIKKHKNDLLFLPLGGAGEIGMNLNLYQYQGKWLMVDLGAGFPEQDHFPGIDLVVPDIRYILEHKEDLLGLVITHAHEDHLGAVQYLWHLLRCPIYTTPFTACFLKAKLQETEFAREIKIIELAPRSKFDIGPFNIEFVPLTHSTPEMQALFIRTAQGNIFHTGDWKFDDHPLIGEANDEKLLSEIGDEGVLALVGDSTNVFNDSKSGSEGELRPSLIKLVRSCEKLVVVTTFASNVARLESIIEAGKQSGRKIAFAGRSLWRVLDAGRQSGYFQDIPEILEIEHTKNIPKSKLLVIATGCQGEPLAAVTKMATDSFRSLRLDNDDTVIFSSKIIPGNEKKIFRLFNKLVRLGVEVFTEKDHFVHVSGHPSSVELKKMYDLIRPKIAVPVHGELVHMHEHTRLARLWGIKHTLQMENGYVARLSGDKPEVMGKVESGYVGVDGFMLIHENSPILKVRRRIKKDGLVFISLLIFDEGDGQYNFKINVRAPGLFDRNDHAEFIDIIREEVLHVLSSHIRTTKKKGMNIETIENLVRSSTRRIIEYETNKSPVIELLIERL